MPKTLQLPPGYFAAEFRAQSYNADDNTIDCVWTSGATVRRMSFQDGPYDEELVVSANAVRLGRLNAGAPLLDTHMDMSVSNVLGSVVPGSARIVAGQGIARIALSKAPGDADSVAKIRDGIVRNVSTGYVRHTIEKTERDNAVPLWRVTDWEPMELTACAIGADPVAQFRSAEKPGQRLFDCTFTGDAAAELARARLRLRQRRLARG